MHADVGVFFYFLSFLFVFQKLLPEHWMNGNERKKQENWELNRSKRKKIYMLSQKNKRWSRLIPAWKKKVYQSITLRPITHDKWFQKLWSVLLGRFEFYIYIYLISSKLNLQSSYTLFTYLFIYLFYMNLWIEVWIILTLRSFVIF